MRTWCGLRLRTDSRPTTSAATPSLAIARPTSSPQPSPSVKLWAPQSLRKSRGGSVGSRDTMSHAALNIVPPVSWGLLSGLTASPIARRYQAVRSFKKTRSGPSVRGAETLTLPWICVLVAESTMSHLECHWSAIFGLQPDGSPHDTEPAFACQYHRIGATRSR